MKDLDRLYNDYAAEWFREKRAEGMSFEQMEELHEGLYEKWGERPCPELDGKTPFEYASSFSEKEIAEELSKYEGKRNDPPYVLLCAAASKKGMESALLKMLRETRDGQFFVLIGGILNDLGSGEAVDIFIDTVFDDCADKEARSFAAEILSGNIDVAAHRMIARLDNASHAARVFACDALYTFRHFRVSALLKELLVTEGNIPLYAAYAVKQGDEMLVPALKEFAADCDYVDFLELRNAVEALGGEFDIERDFSADPYFLKLSAKKK